MNGDCYVANASQIKIFDTSGTVLSPILLSSSNLVFSESENNIYTSNGTQISQIDGDTRLVIGTITQAVNTKFYYNIITNKVYFGDGSNLCSLQDLVVTTITSVTGNPDHYDIDPYNSLMYVSSNGVVYTLDTNDNVINSYNIGVTDGELIFSPFDRNAYYFTNPLLYVISNASASIVATVSIGASVSNSTYNFSRNSIYGTYLSGSVFELTSTAPFIGWTNSIATTYSVVNDNYYGTLSQDYVSPDDLLIKTREFIRKPRYGFETASDNQVSYKWQWEEDNIQELMIIDFSGEQLATTGSYVYTGPIPLDDIRLNKSANKNVENNALAKFQQTVFNEVTFPLDFIDSTTDITFEPEPIEIYLAFNSDEEGVKSSTLLLKEVEDISFDIIATPINNNILIFINVETNTDLYAQLNLDVNSTDTFLNRNLKVGQIISIEMNDTANLRGQFVSQNSGLMFKIRSIGARELILDYITTDILVTTETNKLVDYPTSGLTTYLLTTFIIEEKIIANIKIYGQTEIEDIRYKIELNNVGHNLYPEDAYVFKDYEIEEIGIDWTYLNKKRKEMLLVKNSIFNYVGSYKAIINAINLFGYNDLELYEYYRNINAESTQFGKLFKVEIPDIFDNSVPGWNENDYFKNTFNNENYEVTNLFNLTYKITDKEGNFLFAYSTNEVIVKLSGLKKWLSKNVVPITHKILDITGRVDFVANSYIFHDQYDITILNQRSYLTPVVHFINEAYVLPINSGSTVENVVIDLTYDGDATKLPDYFNINIKTYQTYPEWKPFQTYSLGQYVRYFNSLYVSVLSQNRLNNPRRYDNTPLWSVANSYVYNQIVGYQNRFYRYLVQNPFATYQQKTLSIGIDPYGLVISNSKTYITLEAQDKVAIVNNFDLTIGTYSISVGNSPTQIQTNEQNNYIYVLTTGSIDLIDRTTDVLSTSISTGLDIPIEMIINNTNGKLYFSTSANDIRVYDASLNLLNTLVFSNPITNITWAKNLNRIYAADTLGSSIKVINSATDLQLLSIATTIGSKMVFNNFDNFLYYIDGSGFLRKTVNAPSTFSVYNTSTIIDFVVNDITGRIYVNDSSGNIIEIDTLGNILNTTLLGVTGIMVLDIFNSDLYISDTITTTLVIFNFNTNTVKTTLLLSDSSNAMIFDNARNSIYGLINTTNEFFSIGLKNTNDIPFNNADWSDVTEWEKVDYKPIQTINEFRKIGDLTPLNFTVDSNIDPYILVGVTSDNGYGQIYTDRKSYELYISEDGSSTIISTDPVQSSDVGA